eukprot:NODE_588_length_6359_cov_0.522843.p1 type:complete len:584 gc:universal NODE_588_length_6359_cov_0.522843:405-2156(+)
MLANMLNWDQILRSQEYESVTSNDLLALLNSNTTESQAIISQFYAKKPELFNQLLFKLPLQYSIINTVLEHTDTTFSKSCVSNPKFKTFVLDNLTQSCSLLKLLTIVMVDQSVLNQIIEWIGKDKLNSLLKSQDNPDLRDLLTCYFIGENTVGVNSWSNPENKTSVDDIESMYLMISDRLKLKFNLTDLKSVMFLSSMAPVKDMISNNFSQFDLLFKSFIKSKDSEALNILYQILNNVIRIPKPKSEQDIKMIQMKLMSLGVDQDTAFDPNVLKEDESAKSISNRISCLIKNFDMVYYYAQLYKLFICHQLNSKAFSLFLDSITSLTTPAANRSKLVADGLLKLLLGLLTKSEVHRLPITFNIARLLTSTNPTALQQVQQFVPIVYELIRPGNDYEYQLQGIMALTNLCCTGDPLVLDKIFKDCSITFTSFLKSYMTHEIIELRRVAMELFTNMLQCDSFAANYFEEANCLYEDVLLVWLFTFEEDKYLQYAAMGAMAYLSYASHIKSYLLTRSKFLDELKELTVMRFKIEQSHFALIAILQNMLPVLSVEVQQEIIIMIKKEVPHMDGRIKEAMLELLKELK